MTQTKGNSNRECIAQGAANIVNGLFGGMGGCAMIGQSMINIKSGGKTRISGIVASLGLLVFILFASSLIEMIPIAALAGVMFMVVIGTFAWNTFKVIGKIPLTDTLMIIMVTSLTVIYDLAIAVLAGVIVSALTFAWKNATHIRAKLLTDNHGIRHYEIYGSLYFGSAASFRELFSIHDDPDATIIDFSHSRIADQSALEAINKLAGQYRDAGKTIHLRNLSADCHQLIKKAEKICDVHIVEDADYSKAIFEYRKQRLSPVSGAR